MYLCITCLQPDLEDNYEEEGHDCDKDCRGIVLKVDEIFLPTIVLLRKKGYGIAEYYSRNYLDDSTDRLMGFHLGVDRKYLYPIPSQFYLTINGRMVLINYHEPCMDIIKRQEYRFNAANELLMWARGLSPLRSVLAEAEELKKEFCNDIYDEIIQVAPSSYLEFNKDENGYFSLYGHISVPEKNYDQVLDKFRILEESYQIKFRLETEPNDMNIKYSWENIN